MVDIGNRQIKVRPNKEFRASLLKTEGVFECQNVLLICEDSKISVGRPYLATTLKFKVLGDVKERKVKLSTYKAKANTRKLGGSRAKSTRLVLEQS